MQFITPEIIAHANCCPPIVPGWCTIGPTPFALTIHQNMKARQAIGVIIVLKVKKCRLTNRLWEQPWIETEGFYVHCVNRIPYEWQWNQPKQQKAHKIFCIRSRRRRHRVCWCKFSQRHYQQKTRTNECCWRLATLPVALLIHRIPQYLTAHHTIYYILSSKCADEDSVLTHHAIAALLKTHHRLPKMPKLVLFTTGNVMWCIAPGRAFKTTNGVTTV